MGLFSADLYRSFAAGFGLGTIVLAVMVLVQTIQLA
jgi:hypothetical protein